MATVARLLRCWAAALQMPGCGWILARLAIGEVVVMKTLLVLGGMILMAAPAGAQTCQYIGTFMYCSNGVNSQQIGNIEYYNNGQTRQRIGNMDYYSPPIGQPVQPIQPTPMYQPPIIQPYRPIR